MLGARVLCLPGGLSAGAVGGHRESSSYLVDTHPLPPAQLCRPQYYPRPSLLNLCPARCFVTHVLGCSETSVLKGQ